MAKVKFHYDEKTLSYKQINRSFKSKMINGLLISFSLLLVSILGFSVLSQFIQSSNEKYQARELSNLKLHYGLVSKKLDNISTVLTELQERDNNIYRVYFEANPIPKEQRLAGFGGINRYKNLEGFDNSKIIIDASKKMDILSKQLYVQSISFDEIIKLAKGKKNLLESIPAIQPIANKELKRLASGFGYRMHPVYKTRKFHGGMDFSAPKGTLIYATGNGKVSKVKKSRRGYGNQVIIDHGFGYTTLYAHMSKIIVKRRQKIKRGDVIGYVGSTGTSTGSHLHYEVRKKGKRINPAYFYFNDLSPEEYERMIEVSSQEGQSMD
ncbi:MAG: M23 family metallopeptidase [Flavobacteriaceae bacterium]|nr:M23 family metallopeptidase [Flavobacteriaceae bacterium]